MIASSFNQSGSFLDLLLFIVLNEHSSACVKCVFVCACAVALILPSALAPLFVKCQCSKASETGSRQFANIASHTNGTHAWAHVSRLLEYQWCGRRRANDSAAYTPMGNKKKKRDNGREALFEEGCKKGSQNVMSDIICCSQSLPVWLYNACY